MRKTYIDNLRSITVCLVVCYHVLYLFNAVIPLGVTGPFAPVQPQDCLQYLLYPWFMALLFLLSGMCARFELSSRTPKVFLRKRTRKYLVPSTVGLLVLGWLQGLINMRISDAFATLPDTIPAPVLYLIACLSGTGVLWFIQMLWLFSCLLLLVRRVSKGRLEALFERIPCSPIPLLLMGLLAWGAAQVLNTPIIAVYRFGIYAYLFLLGYLYFARDAVIDRLSRYAPCLLPAALALGILYTCRAFGENYAVTPYVNRPLACLYLWVAVLALLGAGKRYLDRPLPGSVFFHRHSWGLYLFHYFPLSLTGLVLTQYTALPPLCIYLLTAVAAFAGALLLEALLSHIPGLRWCLLGMGKES